MPGRWGDEVGGAGEWRDLNRRAWNERVPIHTASAFYDVEGFLAGRSSLRDFEPAEVGPVDGATLLHLQCHFGQDTLSWARLGASVVGLDFSDTAITAAIDLASRAGLADRAEFLCADVYDAVAAVGGRQFDVVYTGLGALVWLPDIVRWAGVVADLVAPGGILYVAEFHPVADVFDDDDLRANWPYFNPDGMRFDDDGTYTDVPDGTVTEHNGTWNWTHPIGSVVSAVIDAGLTVELLHEFDFTLWPRWPFLEQRGFTWHLPPDRPSLPLMYSLRARKPAA